MAEKLSKLGVDPKAAIEAVTEAMKGNFTQIKALTGHTIKSWIRWIARWPGHGHHARQHDRPG